MFNPKTGLVAALFFLSISEVFVDTNLILVQGVGSFFLISTIYFLWRAVKGEPEFFPLAGGTLALATLVDYTNLVLLILLVGGGAYVWYRWRFRKGEGPSLITSATLAWVLLAVIVFVAILLPWVDWNIANVGGHPLASLQAGLLSAQIPTSTLGGFYLSNLPGLLGIPGLILLILGLADRRTISVKRRRLLVLWIGAYLICLSIIPNRQYAFYIDWSAPLAAFAALGAIRLEGKVPGRSKVLVWCLIALWLGYSYFVAVNASLYASPFSLSKQYDGVKNYDEFMQVVNWIDANTNHTTIGASDLGPMLSYFSNRLFYNMSWVSGQSNSSGTPIVEYMREIGISLVIVRSTYLSTINFYDYPGLVLVRSFSDYLVFQVKP
jgi:hypothetical protein